MSIVTHVSTTTTTTTKRWLPVEERNGGTVWRAVVVLVVCLVVWCGPVGAQSPNQNAVDCQSDESCSQTFSVPEDADIGTYIGTAGQSESSIGLPFKDFFPADYSKADARQAFSVDLSTGRITTKSSLDRETVPNGRYIFVLQSHNSIFLLVTVNLLDVNDNSPAFSPTSRTLNFSESAPFSTKTSLGSVNDPDLGINSTQTCQIVSGNGNHAFSLLQKMSGDYDIILDLKVNATLDYETNPFYDLVIRATDGGGRTGEMTVRIIILDQNDNQPIFNTSKYEVSIAENATVGTSVIAVQATDQDSGPNGRIRYSIDPNTDPDSHFRIDPDTGIVRVHKPLDYETQSTFTLTLEATDDGPRNLVGNAALDIRLENINEQPANIRLVYLQGADRQGHIPENTRAGTPVARISIDDPDISVDRQDDVNVDLFGGDDVFGLQITDDILSLVVVNTPPDREKKASYDLTVIVTDAGNPPLRASESFTIYIEDVNDNAPNFTQRIYEAEVQETAEVGTVVLRVSAADPDLGDNAKISYAIEGSSNPQAGWFEIDRSTGVITTRARVDCELNAKPVFLVTARDNGDPPRTGNTTVVVVVRDVNDKQPEFETSFYNARVAEDASIGDCPIQVHASDPECGSSAPVMYQLVRNDGEMPELDIGQDNGRICVQSPGLDYEERSNYQFLVRAVDRNGLSASAVVQITVTDVNDNRPYFNPLKYPLSVESTVAQGPLLTVQGEDLDSGDFGTLTYSFVSGNGNEYFRIDDGSGTISLVKPFPRNTRRVFQLQVQATDKGGRMALYPAQVQISVYSGNMHPPVFTMTMYNFTVSEDVSVGSLVGQVEATVQSSSGTSPEIQYSIDCSTRDWFLISPSTGKIYTNHTLDREVQQFVVLCVRAQISQPQNLSSTAQVNFTLLDVNDNAPYFPVSSMLQIEVKEAAVLHNPVFIARATDIDAGNNGLIRYRLGNDPGGLFDIDDESGELFIHSMLNYEHRHSYDVVIVAEDQADRGRRSSSMTLTVNVKDINDNRPVFSQDVYDLYVNEDADIGQEFGNVSATDADSEHNGQVSYTLEASPYQSVFGIFSVQGVFSTRDRLDRESQDLYTLTVIATDHGTPLPSSTTAIVRIHVTDSNDNDPEFSRSEYKFSILENEPRGNHVGQISASDRDIGQNQKLEYHFSVPQDNFTINIYSGEITTLVPLDRETQELYTLAVYVTDSGEPPRSDSAVVKIQVLDVNDNQPVFPMTGEYRVPVSENRPKGLQVVRVKAVDKDAGENGTVSFFLDSGNTDADALNNFSIHPTTGWISTEEVLDYESQSQYVLKVVAHDNGHPRKSHSLPVFIDVLDDNEEGPLFHAREINEDLVENVPIGTAVCDIQAEVRDFGQNGNVKYHLVGGNVFSLFAIHPSSGVVQTVRQVDYEESSSHTLSIQAVDTSSAFPRSSNISVVVQIIDVNDNSPVFDNDPVFLRTVRENTPVGQVVYTFIASDRDSGLNGTIRYSVLSQWSSGPALSPSSAYFKINSASGELTLIETIDYEQVHSVSLVVQAEDACPVPSFVRSSQVTAVVLIRDVNDNGPTFESTSEVRVYEDELVGSSVSLVVALDKDSNEDDSGNNVVRYSIVSGNEDGKFRLDQTSGLLTIFEALDRETRASYVLNVSAEDSGVPKMAAYQQLRVVIEDVNDNAPLFEQSEYQGAVNETRPSGTSVISVRATDNDKGENGNVSYMIPLGMGDDKFVVNAATGLITTTQPLDREEQDVYTITVYAKDGGYPSLFDVATVTIQVSDVNDHSPVFDEHPDQQQLKVPENQPQDGIVTIVATDLDTGINADISYSISGGNDYEGNFQIDSTTGELSCRALDREETREYRLVIRGTDSGFPPRSGSVTVTVTVLDENDNSPRFDQPTYTSAIAEDVATGQTVLRVSASDPDEGRNGVVTYSLPGNDTQGFFSVNSTSGDIITSGVFDREKNASFDFLLLASDEGGAGPRSSTVRVRIIVRDVNDNAPKFRQVPYKATVAENTQPGHTVLQMIADDADSGANGSVRYHLQSGGGDASSSFRFFQIHSSTGRITTKTSLSQAAGYHSLLVVASDEGSPAQSTIGVAEIIVGSGSSSPPLSFDRELYVAELPEYMAVLSQNVPVGRLVVTVRASSSSSGGAGTVRYTFVSGNDLGIFTLGSRSGEVRVADPTLLDYESTPQLELVVAATAGSDHAYTRLQVNLLDENDNSPRFAQTMYVSSIRENNQPQTHVTQVWAKDADSGRNGKVVYHIIQGNTDDVFEIFPPDSGVVRTNIDRSRLDREIISSYILVIEAEDQGFPPQSTTCILHITIVDENDNAPKFPSFGPGPIHIAENQRMGHDLVTVTATDVDLNPVLVYDFTPQGNPEGTFSIDRSTGTLRLATSLDFEYRSHYTVGLQVTDGQHTVSTTQEIVITDVNDNGPHFSQPYYQASVAENKPAGHSVLSVSATDADSGVNAAITYTLGAASSPGFSIDPNNGTIFTTQTITSSSSSSSLQSVIQLVVAAHDGGTPSLSTLVSVQIRITDINNFDPQFIKTNYSARVKESLQKGSEIVRVSATDRDFSHRSDNVHYALSGPAASTFYIQSDTGHVLLNSPLDHERTERYDLVAKAVDRGAPSRNATVPVTIFVTDENDNPPAFSSPFFFVTLQESFPADRIFFTLNATDADDEGYKGNPDVEYSITSGNSDGVFRLVQNGGLVVASSLDFETKASHRLIVRALDCGRCGTGGQGGEGSAVVPRLASLVTVVVNVTDVNEFPPKFPLAHYQETVPENLAAHSTIFRMNANDLDGGQFGQTMYSILPGLDRVLFDINSTTGDVIALRPFDYEDRTERKVYNITVQAMDRARMNDTAFVTISVTDEDEFPPQFLNKSYTFEVPGSAKAGAFVGVVTARDSDGGAAGKLVYSFDHPADYFHLDPLSGNITVAHTLHKDVGEEPAKRKRKKRALVRDSETLIVRVSSGLENSYTAAVTCIINIDRACAGCQAPAQLEEALGSVAIAMIVLVCILVPLIIIIVLLVFICRRRSRKGVPSSLNGDGYVVGGRGGGGVGGSLGITPPPLDDLGPLPSYKDVVPYNNHLRSAAKVTAADLSTQSHNSASSGRGSVEVEDEDEEIRRINATNYLTNLASYRHKAMPDSGIQQDDDNLSEPVATNHQEYLAHLGIDSSKIGKSSNRRTPKGSTAGSSTGGDMTFCVESMHHFGEGSGGGEEALDFDRLTDTEVDEEMVMIENSRQQMQALNLVPAGGMSFQAPEPQQTGTLSNVVNSEEEYSGSYNWDYLLDWGPQYQPLAHVFSEIAKLKDESMAAPKKTPVKTVPQKRINGGQGLSSAPQARILPPPIITSAPPPLSTDSGGDDSEIGSDGSHRVRSTRDRLAQDSSRHHHHHQSPSAGRSQRANMNALPSLPRSPISYEGSFGSAAITPSFTPSLSHLGSHSPSISPAGNGHAGGGRVSDPRGPNTAINNAGRPQPSRLPAHQPRHLQNQHPHHHRQHYPPHHLHHHNIQHAHAQFSPNSDSNSNSGRVTLSGTSSDSEREFRI